MTLFQNKIINIIEHAGKLVMDVYASNDFEQRLKLDNSPLTEADLTSHKYISQHLPDYPVLSEEGREIPYEERSRWKTYWCIDPLDGTKEFLKRNGEFVINIALIENNVPIMGFVHVPVQNKTYWASKGYGAYVKESDGTIKEIHTNLPTDGPIKVFVSRSHFNQETQDAVDKLQEQHPNREFNHISMGSALKFVAIADGTAQYYPRYVPTMEWDTAAPQVILEEAGGKLVNIETGEPLLYNKECLKNPFLFASYKN